MESTLFTRDALLRSHITRLQMPISTPSNGTPKHGRLKTAFPTLVDDPNSTSSSRRSRGPNSIGDTRSRWRPRTVVSFSRWIQHVHVYYPGYSLTHTAEDVGDCCGRIDIQLERKDLPDDERQRLLLEKNTHLGAAVGQRRTVSKFVNEYVKQHAPDQKVPDTVILEHYDDKNDAAGVDPSGLLSVQESNGLPTIQSQIEDFGGSFAMPHYGHIRPSADYFNSNLMVRNFVPADITSRVNNVIFYDERATWKGCRSAVQPPLRVPHEAAHNEDGPHDSKHFARYSRQLCRPKQVAAGDDVLCDAVAIALQQSHSAILDTRALAQPGRSGRRMVSQCDER
ncbi:unnamed protein product [Lampetra fluviatilis]